MKYDVETIEVFLGRGSIEIPDEGEVLTAEFRGPNRVVLVVTVPTIEQYECGGEKSDGDRCQTTVGGPDERCHWHE